MSNKKFNIEKIKYKKLGESKNLLNLSDLSNKIPSVVENTSIDELSDKMIQAKYKKASIIVSFGAHSIRNGLTSYFKWFIDNKLITHFATNGASVIHDWELAHQGATLECVKTGLEQGTFGLWEETNYHINHAINIGAEKNIGFGESIGKYIDENPSLHHYRESSLFHTCYNKRIPITVHPCYGQDIFYLHPTSKGENIGKVAQIDLLKYADSMKNLSDGVYINIGSAVMGPMIFEKCFAAVQNIKMQEGKKLENFKVFCVDLAQHVFDEEKKDSNYFRRFQKTFSRVQNSQYLQCDNLNFIASLKKSLESKI
jgi:deoxyhypusine synthase